MGYNPKLQEGSISNGLCRVCAKKETEALYNTPNNPDGTIKQEAENQVNYGAEVNMGMQAYPTIPTGSQDEQMQNDMAANMDAMQNYKGMDDFKKGMNPEMKQQLLGELSKLKISFPQLSKLVNNPQSKQFLMSFLQEISGSDEARTNNIQGIMQGLKDFSEREIHQALNPAPALPPKSTDQIIPPSFPGQ